MADEGYRGPAVCKIVGITYRQLDYWARTDLIRPSVADARGSGTQRRYSYRDLVELKVIKGLLDAGVSLQSARKAVEYLRTNLGEDIATASLVIDGSGSVLVRTDGELVDLVRRGQGVLSIVALGGVKEALDAAITDLHRPEEAAVAATSSNHPAAGEVSGAKVSGAKVSGAKVSGAQVSGAKSQVEVRTLAPPDTAGAGPVDRDPVEQVLGDPPGLRTAPDVPAPPLPHTTVRFAHNSELQFAKLLDFYGVAWEYEPRTFVLETDREGNPSQAFAPDFYLPAYDLFIEITTMNQKLVTKKNRKARRLRELHPDVRIKVFYQRDYLNLLVKYGLEPPSQDIPVDESVEPLPLRFDDVDDESPGESHQRGRKPA